jgi:hypothetical protein
MCSGSPKGTRGGPAPPRASSLFGRPARCASSEFQSKWPLARWGPAMVELEVHVVGERIIVNLPGARFTMTFTKDPDSPGIIERSIGPGTIMSLPFRPASVPMREPGWLRARRRGNWDGFLRAASAGRPSLQGSRGPGRFFFRVLRRRYSSRLAVCYKASYHNHRARTFSPEGPWGGVGSHQ